LLQKYAAIGTEVLQFQHSLVRLEPQELQNFALFSFISPHFGQVLGLRITKYDLFSDNLELVWQF